MATNNHTGSPTVTTHGLTSDSRLDSRTHDPHNTIRGNVQATSHNTTIQVIASGSQVHIPTPLLNTKNPVFNSQTPPNMLKIGVSTHGNSSSALPPAAGLKLGIGKYNFLHYFECKVLSIEYMNEEYSCVSIIFLI